MCILASTVTLNLRNLTSIDSGFPMPNVRGWLRTPLFAPCWRTERFLPETQALLTGKHST